jgi:hypothetical protein
MPDVETAAAPLAIDRVNTKTGLDVRPGPYHFSPGVASASVRAHRFSRLKCLACCQYTARMAELPRIIRQ